MKVCIIGYRDYSTCTRAVRAAEALAEAGIEVHYVGTLVQDKEAPPPRDGIVLHNLAVRKRLRRNILGYFPLYALLLIDASIRITVLHLRHRFDAIVVYSIPDFLIFSTIVPKLLGSRIILEMLDLMPETAMTKFGLREDHLLVKCLKISESVSMWLADILVVPNHPFPQTILARGANPAKIHVVMNLPDRKVFHPIEDEGSPSKFTLFFHGTIAERLDLKTLLRAVDLARVDILEIELQIIGDGEYAGTLERLITDLNLKKHVSFSRGMIAADRLPALIAAAHVGIATYVRSAATERIMPTKVMEFIAMEKPVITARLYTTQFYFDESMVMFYEPGDPEDLASCIRQLHKSPEKRRCLVNNAKRFEEKYSWGEQKGIYVQLVQGKETT